MRPAVVILVLWLAAILRLACARHLAILGAEPDFILVAVAVCSLCLNRVPAAFTGFAGGLIEGALAGADITHYVISRSLAGFCASWSRRLRFEMTSPAVALTVASVTILTRIVFMFTAAPSGIGGFLGATIGVAMYNGVLAMPVYALLKRVLNPPVR